MTFLSDLVLDDRFWLLGVAGIALVIALWLGWRKPTLAMMIALVFLAVRPELLWGGPRLGYGWGLHHTLIAWALVVNALRYGVRVQGGWPILGLLATFALGLALGDVHPRLTLPFMLMSLGILALPFTFTQVVLAPGSRRAYALVIMVTPLLSVAVGALLDLAVIDTNLDWDGPWFRLEGATGNAATFAVLAFAGFVVGVHELTRPFRPYAGYLAVVNLALVVLSGSRTAMAASAVFLALYALMSETLRQQVRAHPIRAGVALGSVAAVLVFYWPMLALRFTGLEDEALPLSNRNVLWEFYLEEFWFSPVFGRGFGAGFTAGAAWLQDALPTPHNEYLHLLVIGGAIGLLLCSGGIGLWYRHLLRVVSLNDREFLIALAPALAAYAVTDNLLIYATSLAAFFALGLPLTRSAVDFVPGPERVPEPPGRPSPGSSDGADKGPAGRPSALFGPRGGADATPARGGP